MASLAIPGLTQLISICMLQATRDRIRGGANGHFDKFMAVDAVTPASANGQLQVRRPCFENMIWDAQQAASASVQAAHAPATTAGTTGRGLRIRERSTGDKTAPRDQPFDWRIGGRAAQFNTGRSTYLAPIGEFLVDTVADLHHAAVCTATVIVTWHFYTPKIFVGQVKLFDTHTATSCGLGEAAASCSPPRGATGATAIWQLCRGA